MSQIITLTVNPSVDKSIRIKGLQPDRKLRGSVPTEEPGGGGVNVSRAIYKLGGTSACVYLAGGHTGDTLKRLLDQEGIAQHPLRSSAQTRESFMVFNETTQQQYRFVPDGYPVAEADWKLTLRTVSSLLQEGDYLVASGSLPPGVPTDYYAQVTRVAHERAAKVMVNTSGEALQQAVGGGVYLLKPNLGELSTLTSQQAITAPEQERLAQQLVEQGRAEVVVVSLGAQGAMLVSKDEVTYIAAPTVPKKTTVGAGDSMVGGMVLRLSQGWATSDAVRYGVACGTAATMNHGTQLCRAEDVDRLYRWMQSQADEASC